jgi:hypothetical protein
MSGLLATYWPENTSTAYLLQRLVPNLIVAFRAVSDALMPSSTETTNQQNLFCVIKSIKHRIIGACASAPTIKQ